MSKPTTIRKRDGSIVPYDPDKIKNAVRKAFAALHESADESLLDEITADVEAAISADSGVEDIQDQVEKSLMRHGQFDESKAYILYRQKHEERREIANQLAEKTGQPRLKDVFARIQKDFDQELYDLKTLELKFRPFYKKGMSSQEALEMLEKAAVELTSMEAPKWEKIAGRILACDIEQQVENRMKALNIRSWYEKLEYLTKEKLLGDYLLKNYTKEQIEELAKAMVPERDDLYSHSSLDLLARRYLICSHSHEILETPQEMFMLSSMHLAMNEKDKVYWAKKFYYVLSTLKATMATPTLANSRKPFHQMSSCFIDTMEDSLNGIYKTLDCFAQVSKHGGGMGIYMGKVRATGSDIRGFEGAAGGVLRWTKLINDTAVAVDQLGVRQGAAAVYLDAWHMDLPEFLQMRTNNGDDRLKAHDIFPAVCYPDLFWKLARENLDNMWHMMDPHEILTKRGYALEDCYGKEWEEKYYQCVHDPRIRKRSMPIREVVRLIIKSQVETGTPFTFNRDLVNEMNPNKHEGIIYSSNLCTEIAQNMSAMDVEAPYIKETEDGPVIVQLTKPGDFVTCNLASLSLGHINVHDDKELEDVISTVMRALDNVIDLNQYPLPNARLTSQKYRPVGLGTSGYQHLLAKEHISFESQRHLTFMNELYEKINYYTLKASWNLAKEKGRYSLFEGSDYANGSYFTRRGYNSPAWKELEENIQKDGIRNGYLLAIAPTSSTSIIAGTTPAVDPLIHKFYLEEKKGSIIPRVAPDLSIDTMWYYKNAHYIDQNWVIDSAAVRQRHIDQAQSVNLFITNEYTFRKILNLYIRAWEKGVKTIYYVRSRSLEVEECESCSA